MEIFHLPRSRTQVSILYGLIALCRSAVESSESKLLTKLTPVSDSQVADVADDTGELTASASDRSKKGSNILLEFYFFIYKKYK